MPENCHPVDKPRAKFRYSLTYVGQNALTTGHTKVAEGAFCEVWFSKKTLKVYEMAPAEHRARMGRVIEHLSEHGPNDLNDQQFKAEGRFPTGGRQSRQIMVCAVKSFQLRVYGYWIDGPPRRFMCPEGVIKKTNKADQEQLKRVAQSVGE